VRDKPPCRFTAAIFDLGGVVIDWNPRHLYRKLFPGDEPAMERFLREIATPDWNRQLDGGRPFQEAIDELAVRHPEHAHLLQAYGDRWPEMLGEVDEGTAGIIRELAARGMRVFALSNWSAETYPLASGRIPELALFDDVLISGEAKRTKPDPLLFQHALARFGVDATEAFFVDDQPENVEGAERAGIRAIKFIDSASLRATLEDMGLL
jgi:2-haloacid dehalogenase